MYSNRLNKFSVLLMSVSHGLFLLVWPVFQHCCQLLSILISVANDFLATEIYFTWKHSNEKIYGMKFSHATGRIKLERYEGF